MDGLDIVYFDLNDKKLLIKYDGYLHKDKLERNLQILRESIRKKPIDVEI